MANVATPRAGLDPALEEAIGDLRARRPRSLAARERFSAFALGGGFLAAAVATLALFQGSDRTPDPLVVALLVVAFGAAFRLDFEVATGFAVPTQLVLVPMLFVVPLTWVPSMAAGGILVGGAIDYFRRAIHVERIFLSLVNGWYVYGPVMVLGLAGEEAPRLASVPLYLGALAAQFAVDFGSAAAHERLTLGVRPEIQFRAMSLVWLVDAALSSVGLAVAFPRCESPRRSSTNRERSRARSARSSTRTRSRASGCSRRSVVFWAKWAPPSAPATSAGTERVIPTGLRPKTFRWSLASSVAATPTTR
jgi:hypothetical protein